MAALLATLLIAELMDSQPIYVYEQILADGRLLFCIWFLFCIIIVNI